MQINKINDFSSPLELFTRLFSDKPFCFFLDGQMDHGKLGRFSFMGAEPFLVLRSKGRLIEVTEGRGAKDEGRTKKIIGNPFDVLKELLDKYKSDVYSDEIPFLGGAVGYFSYDLCHFIEKLPSTAIDDINIPDMWVGFYDEIVAVDNKNGKTYAVANGNVGADPRVGPIIAGRTHGSAPTVDAGSVLQRGRNIQSNFLKDDYLAAINKAKEYIRNGDIYQVNLSQRFEADLDLVGARHAVPLQLYKTLRRINPAPFAAYLDFGEGQVISASPERFLKVDAKNRYIETRPIKGTRSRGMTRAQDEKLANELLNSAKDRAEHIMIVDLERNDLGRVCDYGSVKWPEQMALEKYSTVHHLVSTVSGTLKEGTGPVDCLINCFPGGSITGAPKIRSMEIIDELEPTKRSVYTGAMGYIGFNGNMDTSVVIRTFIVRNNKVYFQAGGGIVADSDPEAEYQETLDKARALMQAIGTTGENIYVGADPRVGPIIKGRTHRSAPTKTMSFSDQK